MKTQSSRLIFIQFNIRHYPLKQNSQNSASATKHWFWLIKKIRNKFFQKCKFNCFEHSFTIILFFRHNMYKLSHMYENLILAADLNHSKPRFKKSEPHDSLTCIKRKSSVVFNLKNYSFQNFYQTFEQPLKHQTNIRVFHTLTIVKYWTSKRNLSFQTSHLIDIDW